MSNFKSKFIVFVFLLSASFSSFGHQLSTSYLTLKSESEKPQNLLGKWQVEVKDLEQVIDFDINNDGNITWQEVTLQQSAISQFIKRVLTITQKERQCIVSSQGPLKLDSHFNLPYLDIPILVNCQSTGAFAIKYDAFFDFDSNHKSLISINNTSFVYDITDSEGFVGVDQVTAYSTAVEYLYQGILHIWMGLDHILFLIALLLTCVLIREQNKWLASPSKVQILKQTAWIVTAFTIAHSITLTATAMGIIAPSSKWVEIGIAISVVVAALNNIWPVVIRLGWVTFGFGLLHGMGFAGVLGELGLSNEYQLLSVLTFNLGVEIGQLAILAVTLPLLILAREFNWYQRWLMPAGSLVIAIIATQWTIERF
ncbi:HupE/UreJ family protein [Psychrosphaera aestuarii]|uniref:HupE/UreJ family protein n=1 Tax=Psychrosphaera aestuarii TaxID=1266052 RepID=UPI001B340D39|nr:HupE/UreJ family protein [Psychrosphaera aestuarii]